MTRPISNARHPVTALLRESVYAGTAPDPDDIDALQLPPALRERFTNAVDESLALHRSGARGEANEHALQASYDLVGDLPDRLQDPAAYRRDPLADVDDPTELAAAVDRVGGPR